MTPARRLLLVPLLAPLLAVMVLAALNPAPRLSLRLLTWRSANLPLGAWLALAASGGALLSAAAVGLSLGQAVRVTWSERRRPGPAPAAPSGAVGHGRQADREPWEEDGRPPSAASRAATGGDPGSFWAGPSRPAGEPAPTLSVPFRVIQRPVETVGSGVWAAAPAARSRATAAESTVPAQPASAPPAAAAADQWDAPLPEDW